MTYEDPILYSIMKNYILFTLFIMFLLSLVSFTSVSYAQSNPNLYVSAENTLFQNYFAGPMVIEVIVDDSDISSLTGSLQEPDVKVGDKKLTMVQSDDGKWYGYFADKTQAQKADSLVGLPGYGLDFGEMCSDDSSITGLSLSETSGFAIPRDISSSSNGQETFVTCTGEVSSSDQLINNVVREAPTLNTQSDSIGQIGIDEDVWPLIQLFDIPPNDDVTVKYDRYNGVQSVVLIFDTVDQFATITLDNTTYRTGENIKIDISDVMLNIDPTDEDSWTWASTSDSDGFYYQLFNEDGNTEADGTTDAINIQDGQNLATMMFDNNGILFLDPNSESASNVVTVLQDNDYTILEDKDTSDATIDLGTDTISHSYYPITFTETTSNSGSFVNYDKNGTANLIINPETESGRSAVIEYNKNSYSITATIGSSPTALNFSEHVNKDTSISFTVINDNTDLNDDILYVTISDVSGLDGTAIVNGDNTITFTPDSGFLGTTSFEYMIDDIIDGTNTGTITVIVDSEAILGSIDQITVYSDKSTYAVGDAIDANWIVPDYSSETDTTIMVITPIGTTATSDVFSNSTEYLVNSTNNFVEGTYTIRIEHGQYYGEKSILFVSSEETTTTETTTDTTTEIAQGSCIDNSKISIHLDDTSYTKGEKVSISTELCDVISNEYVITQILDPFNTRLTIDQFLPENTDFDKQYSTDGGLWKLDGKYTIKSTYLDNSVESTFDFVATVEEIPTTELIETIASFVDSDKDPQYYVDRYTNEESYKEWFDTNYSQYDSIYQAVGLDESVSPILNSDNNDSDASSLSTNTPESPSIPESKEPTCGTGTELVNGLCQAIKTDKEPTCGAGTELVNGLCQAIKTDEKLSQENSFFENVFGFFKTLFNTK